MFKPNPDADINETSFHGVTVRATLQQMTARFGEPFPGDGYKTTHEWIFEGPGFNVAVYDYKYNGAVECKWNVGSLTAEQSRQFKAWFDTAVRATK
jgi:uncharacterized protein YodC (DUF2158 family)